MTIRITLLLATALFFMISCNNNDNSSHGQTSTAGKVDYSDEMKMPEYYDLQTNRPVDVMEDSNRNQYVDVSTQIPLTIYYDANSTDTFDNKGRIINNAIIYNSGQYSIDESKVISNTDSLKIKDEAIKKKMAQ